jgi:hypothetical protein
LKDSHLCQNHLAREKHAPNFLKKNMVLKNQGTSQSEGHGYPLVLHNISMHCTLNWVLVHFGGVDIAVIATCPRQI